MLDERKEAFMLDFVAKYDGDSYSVCRSHVYKILKSIQTIENELDINLWEIDYSLFTIVTGMLFDQLSLGNAKYYLLVIVNYYQWGIDRGYTVQKINYAEQLDREKITNNKGYIQAVYFMSYQSLIDDFKIATEVTNTISQQLYDFIVARLLFLGVSLEDICSLSKESLNHQTHDVECTNYLVHLDDELYNLIVHYNSDNYVYNDNETQWRRRRKRSLDLMLPSTSDSTTKVLTQRTGFARRFEKYTKHYKMVTKLYRIFRVSDIYRSGIYNRCEYDNEKKLYKDPLTNEFIYAGSNSNIANYKSMLQ